MTLSLKHNLKFPDLYLAEGCQQLDILFCAFLERANSPLYKRLSQARQHSLALTALSESQLILDIAPYLEEFIADLFNIEAELTKLATSHTELDPLYLCKKLFIQKFAVKQYSPEQTRSFNLKSIEESLFAKLNLQAFDEMVFAKASLKWMEDNNTDALTLAAQYSCGVIYKYIENTSILFSLPSKLDLTNLIPLSKKYQDNVCILYKDKTHIRNGFKLTDLGGSLSYALDQAHYCLYCHERQKDSCSKGLKNNANTYVISPLNKTLIGCPLEQKISEMNLLKAKALPIAALATAIIDNPMVAATGHRICNDCMKACIYQKQEPVDIPEIETRVLKDVLYLPWGFEIYSLLTRWNPLNFRQPTTQAINNYKVLIAGLGPAGFTLAHYLLNDGNVVIAIDGTKIEPLPPSYTGLKDTGEPIGFDPIYDVKTLFEELDERVIGGFGGVAEYGITVRWNKNYLKLIRLLLERRPNFSMYGGIRFGSNITTKIVWDLGFDHIALALGAGKPNLLPIENGLAKNIRAASDFLMALQLTGAAKDNALANLQIRLPVIVIGGGLTAIDTATEALAYYPVQIEKFYKKYKALQQVCSTSELGALWQGEDRIIAEEYIRHAELIQAEKAKVDHKPENILTLLQEWGGVKILYRDKLQAAPCYRLNSEETNKAFAEDIQFVEEAVLTAINLDEYNAVESIVFDQNGRSVNVKARTILLAIGTNPNTILSKEEPEIFKLDGRYFQSIGHENAKINFATKPPSNDVITYIDEKSRAISYFGDLHPAYFGNVVKAMASAKYGSKAIHSILHKRQPSSENMIDFQNKLHNLCTATILNIEYLTDNIIEVTIHAPLAAQQFQPGQFYRLQNYETYAHESNGIKLVMEPLAMTGATVNKELGILSIIALEMGGSSNLCSKLKIGEKVVLMGPSGTPSYIPHNERVLLIGGGLGNAVLFSIGKAMRANKCEVVYFAGYRNLKDRYKVNALEEAADYIVWCCDEGILPAYRKQDKSFHGNIVEALRAYATEKFDRVMVIGSASMMEAIQKLLRTELSSYLNPNAEAIASINSPMQCMMKEICAQCLQRHVDPDTKLETYVYSCYNQDQPLFAVDFAHLHARLGQNKAQEALIKKYMEKFLLSDSLT